MIEFLERIFSPLTDLLGSGLGTFPLVMARVVVEYRYPHRDRAFHSLSPYHQASQEYARYAGPEARDG